MTRIILRREWGAKYRDGFGGRNVRAINSVWLHHTVTASAGANGSFAADAANIRGVEAIGQQRFRGGISYSYLITEAGRVFQGVSLGRVGAHTKGYNTRGIGIALVGNYQGRKPTAAQQSALVWLLQQLNRRLSGGHRDVSQTACPGRYAYALIPQFRRRAAGGKVTVPKPSTPNRPSTKGVLVRGSKGAEVLRLQKHLNKMYPSYSKLAEDSIYGVKTEGVVKEAQRRLFITVDGEAGPNTFKGIKFTPKGSAPKKKPSSGGSSSVSPGKKSVYVSGDSGEEVRALQKVLNKWYPNLLRLAEDAHYGSRTAARVRYLQSAAKGRAGPVDGAAGNRVFKFLGMR